MKASKFTEAQIAFVLKQAGRHAGSRGLPQGGHFGCDVLQLAQEVRGPDAVGDEAASPDRRRERHGLLPVAWTRS